MTRQYKQGDREGAKLADVQMHLTESSFALVVCDESVLFWLPTTDGSVTEDGSLSDTTATLVSEADSAIQWGTDLFEKLWDRSDQIEPYVAREHPELL